jgi:MurNAc alpha-1-phosphate uridylyltransferase
VTNGDIYTDFSFETLRHALAGGDLAHLVMVPNPPSYPQGDFLLDADGRLHAQGTPRLTYAGIGVHRPEFFRDCPPGRFPMLPWWQRAMRLGRVSGRLYAGRWQDVGTPEGLHALGVLNSDS